MNTNSIKLLMEVNDKLITACIFHSESHQLMDFLSLNGFSALHLYQHYSESLFKTKLKTFLIRTYECCPDDTIVEDFGLIRELLKNRSRADIPVKEKCEIIKRAFAEYIKWEQEALSLYEQISRELSSAGDIKSYSLIKELVDDVAQELSELKNMIQTYDLMNWSMEQIIAEQDTLAEKFLFKLKNIFSDIPKYHHFNSI